MCVLLNHSVHHRGHPGAKHSLVVQLVKWKFSPPSLRLLLCVRICHPSVRPCVLAPRTSTPPCDIASQSYNEFTRGSVSRQIRRVDYITPDPRGSLHVHCISRHDSDARRKDAIGLPGAASDFVKWSC
jgi:hypothetical protein